MPRAYTCGVPSEHCNGGATLVSAGLRHDFENFRDEPPKRKAHANREGAFKCRVRYLINVLGYERVGQRELRCPEGKGILVLSKKSKFGGELRSGKGGEGKRYMPLRRHGGLIARY